MIVKTLWANLLIQVITFATSILTARILGPTGRGELALVLLYPQLIAGISLFGIDKAIAVCSGRGELAHPVGTILKLVLLLSIPAMVAGYFTVSWRINDTNLAALATMYLAYVPAMYFFLFVVFLFNGTGDFNRFNNVRLGFYFANLILLLAVLVVTPIAALDWVVLANLVSVYGVCGLAVWLLRNFNKSNDSQTIREKGDVRAVLSLAVVFVLPASLTYLSNFAYQIILESKMGVEPLGLFVVYYSYSRLVSPLGNAISSHVFRHGISGERKDVARIFRLSFIVYVACSILLLFFAKWVIPFLFGSSFVVDVWTVSLLFIACSFALSANSMAEFLKGRKKVKADTTSLVVYLLLLSILGWWLVPTLGMVGMALAMAIGDMLRCIYLVNRVSSETEFELDKFWQVSWHDIIELYRAGKGVIQGLHIWR